MNKEMIISGKSRQILAKNIRIRRKIKNISQEDLADMADLHRTYIGAIERGQQNVSIDNIEKIALALDCQVKELFNEEDE